VLVICHYERRGLDGVLRNHNIKNHFERFKMSGSTADSFGFDYAPKPVPESTTASLCASKCEMQEIMADFVFSKRSASSSTPMVR